MNGSVKENVNSSLEIEDPRKKDESNPKKEQTYTQEYLYFKEKNNEMQMPPVDSPFISEPTRLKQTWAIGGGKGGVGKSLIASSLAIALSRLGNKVVAVDLDLGGANLHTTLGVDLPKQTLGDVMNQRVPDLSSCIVPTGIPNLELISGAHDAMGITNITAAEKIEFLKKMRFIDADYLIFDLGAGTGLNTLDFFNYSDIGFVVLLPEPTSIENGYRFIKNAYYRYLANCQSLCEIRSIIENAMDPKNTHRMASPADVFKEVNRISPELGIKLKKQIELFQPKLIVNQTRTLTDIDIGTSVKTVCKKYFGIDIDYVGHLEYESSVWQSIRKKRPLMLEFSNSKISYSIEQFVHNILRSNELKIKYNK